MPKLEAKDIKPAWPFWPDKTPSRPWVDKPVADAAAHWPRRAVPPQQTEAFKRTHTAVAKAIAKANLKEAGKAGGKGALSLFSAVAKEALDVTADVLEFVPIPVVAKVAGILVKIWEAAEGVETNRLACLRMTERAADILHSICTEVKDADAGTELEGPVGDLEQSFGMLFIFVEKQAKRPFLKRYLKRDDDEKKIAACDKALETSLSKFSISIQMRIYRSVEELHKRVSVIEQTITNISSSSVATPRPSTPTAPAPLRLASPSPVAPASQSPTTDRTFFPALSSADYQSVSVADQIREMDTARAKLLAVLDRRDMVDHIRDVLADGSDAALIQLLQVPKRELPEAQFALRRALEAITAEQTDSQLHREFLEFGVDALHRLSDYRAVPTYTITKYEIDCEKEVGAGSFASVYRGAWQGKTIAIKVLSPVSSKTMFRREVEIWRLLKHRHVLPLWGTSSPDAGPPFFCVSPFMPNGALPQYLRRIEPPAKERLRLMHEIALGMVYLHSRGVVHGDLKAANVLVDGKGHCLIADFGQSDIRSEYHRLSTSIGLPPPPRGTIRWAAPEIIHGEGSLTTSTDAYSYAICCYEIMQNGKVPWHLAEEHTVIRLVYNENRRPTLPRTEDADMLAPHIQSWWARDPDHRPSFVTIANILEGLCEYEPGWDAHYEQDWPNPPTAHALSDSIFSPPLQPSRILASDTDLAESYIDAGSSSSESHCTVSTHSATSVESSGIADFHFSTKSESGKTNATNNSPDNTVTDRQASPPSKDDAAAYRRDERRYRAHLHHTFNKSLRLPLWSPTKVQLGAVGFMNSGLNGSFSTLFNAFHPPESASGDAAFLTLSALVGRQHINLDPPAARQRSSSIMSRISILFGGAESPKEEQPDNDRTRTFELYAERKAAFLFTESTLYQYLESIDDAKFWFEKNINAILHKYGSLHKLQREDIFLVVGTLDAAAWAAYVCHCSGDATMSLNVCPGHARQQGKQWATFEDANGNAEPSYEEESVNRDANWKVSYAKIPPLPESEWETVLLARLCFKPDRETPTSRP